MKKILSAMRRTIQKYNMISDGDKILAAVSGGKDSMVMLKALNELQTFYPKQFALGAICIDIGFADADYDPILKFCNNNKILCHIEKTVIRQVVFDEMQEKSPCSLCARMRRAALCNKAEELGYNKIALGHNRDDANETLLMNIFKNGKIECFEPYTKYDDRNITIIRPLLEIPEGIISSCAKRNNIPVMKKVCPVDGKTDREKTKELIDSLSKNNKKIKTNIFSAIEKLDYFANKMIWEENND